MPSSKNPRADGYGRKKGVKNKKTVALIDATKFIVEDVLYRENLLQRARTGTLGSMEPVLWYYAYGKPRENVKHEGDQTLTVKFGGRYRPEDAEAS